MSLIIKSGSSGVLADVTPQNAVKVDASATLQPVSLAAAVDVSDRTARLLGHMSVDNFPAVQPISGTVTIQDSGNTIDVAETAASLAVSVTGASGGAVTATLPAVAANSHYVTLVEIVKYAVAAITGTATPVVVTSTNLPGAIAWTFETAQAIGTQASKVFVPAKPLRSSTPNTATTIVCPATTSVIWRINVWYVAAP